jgi:spore coat protein CotH
MRRYLSAVGGLSFALVLSACTGGDSPQAGSEPTPPGDSSPAAQVDETAAMFDLSRVHAIEIVVSVDDVHLLVPGSDERVRAEVTFDGERIHDAGVRLKGGLGSEQPLTGKPGFSVDTNAFVAKQELFGVSRFTLGNSTQDPSFVTETLVYELFRRAGVIAPRTALANVSFNGELFGLYVLREGYDKGFLRRNLQEANGNLYEGALGVDVTDVDLMEPRTNEAKGDRSDLEAIARVVNEAPDATFLADISFLVDLDGLLTFWAVEAIADHWDGYIRPNNYYVYHDPATGKFEFFAHGADWAMLDPQYSVLAAPGPSARLANRLYGNPEFQQQLRARILLVLDSVWSAERLLTEADMLSSVVRDAGLNGSRETISHATYEDALAARRQFILDREAAVRGQLGAE